MANAEESQRQNDADANEQQIRDQLIASVAPPNVTESPQMQRPPTGDKNIDPAIGGLEFENGTRSAQEAEQDMALVLASQEYSQPTTPESSKASKAPISSSKRAAQNREAQAVHIRELENHAKEHDIIREAYKASEAENINLRLYISTLQNTLVQLHGTFPALPDSVGPRDSRLEVASGSVRAPAELSNPQMKQAGSQPLHPEPRESGSEPTNFQAKEPESPAATGVEPPSEVLQASAVEANAVVTGGTENDGDNTGIKTAMKRDATGPTSRAKRTRGNPA